MKKQKRYTIYVGLEDKDLHQQKVTLERASALVAEVCKNYSVSFSMVLQNGGYFYHNGAFVDEASMAISLIGAGKKLVREIAADLCCFLNQESVIVTREKISTYTVEESIGLPPEMKE